MSIEWNKLDSNIQNSESVNNLKKISQLLDHF